MARNVKTVSEPTPGLPAEEMCIDGGMTQAANVAKAAGDAPTKAEFDALIDALVAANLMAAAE